MKNPWSAVVVAVVCAAVALLAGCGSPESRAGVRANIDRLGPEVADALGTSYSIWATGAAMEGASGTSEIELPYSIEKFAYLAAPEVVAGCLALVERLEHTGVRPFARVLLLREPVLVDADACLLGAGQFEFLALFELRPVADDTSLDVSARVSVGGRKITVDESVAEVLPVIALLDAYPRQLLATATPLPLHLPEEPDAAPEETLQLHVAVPHGQPVTVSMSCTMGGHPVAAVLNQDWGYLWVGTASYFDGSAEPRCAPQPVEFTSRPAMTLDGPDNERLDVHAIRIGDVGEFELTIE